MDTKQIQRAQFEIKATDEGRFSGAAMIYNVIDSHQDRTLPGAFRKTIAENGGRIRVNTQHADYPLGWGTLRDTSDALLIDVQLEMGMQAARDLFAQVKAGLVGGLSIGYIVRDFRYDKKGVRELLDIDLVEVSAVTHQSVPGALINPASVKAQGDDGSAVIAALSAGTSLFTKNNDADNAILRAVSAELYRIAHDEASDLADDMLQNIERRLSKLEGITS
jgi:HK97 family phage prohead protease